MDDNAEKLIGVCSGIAIVIIAVLGFMTISARAERDHIRVDYAKTIQRANDCQMRELNRQ